MLYHMKGTIKGIQRDELEGAFLLIRLDGHDGEYAYALDEVHKIPNSNDWPMTKRDPRLKRQQVS